MSEPELKPCPFCGGPAYFERHGSTRFSNIIACEDCGCRLETNETFNRGSAWNTRADLANAVKVLMENKTQMIKAATTARHSHACDDQYSIVGFPAAEAAFDSILSALRALIDKPEGEIPPDLMVREMPG